MTLRTNRKNNYEWYKSRSKHPVSQKTFNQINWDLNQHVVDYLLSGEGKKFDFGFRLGYLTIFKFKRKLQYIGKKLKAPVDWGKTRKLHKEGKLDPSKVVYITDPFYIGTRWVKLHSNVKGKYYYQFLPSRTNGSESVSGFKTKLIHLLRKNPLHHTRFPYFSRG